MTTSLKFADEARQEILAGVETLAKAVATTLGPRGRNVGIDKGYENIIVHDGVTVARSIELKNKWQAFGANVLREAAQRQVDAVGDGTTVTTILAHAILQAANKRIAAGENPMALRAELETETTKLVAALKEQAIPVETEAQAVQIATVSAEEDSLGKLVGETVFKVGADGIVTVEESRGGETEVEHQQGMQFDQGYAHWQFVTDPSRMEATVEDASLFITDRDLTNVHDLLPFLERFDKAVQAGECKPNLVIIAREIAGSILASCIENKLRGMQWLCVKAPLIGAKQSEFLQDIALLTGGTFFSEASARPLKEATPADLGHAARVTSTKDATLLVGGHGDLSAITDRVASLRAQLEHETSAFEKEKLRERIAKLTVGVAVIRVGGRTEIEVKERKERAIDAVAATQAAMRSGIVAGGETAYLHYVDNPILSNAIRKPFERLVENAGMNSGQMLEWIIDEPDMGIDVTDGEAKNLIEAGIIDPVEVPINALQNAVSVAIQLMTTEVVIVPDEETKP